MVKSTSKKIRCSSCGNEKAVSQFYSSNKGIYQVPFYGKAPFCKTCCQNKIYDENGQLNKNNFIELLQQLDKPFVEKFYQDVTFKNNPNTIISDYISKLNFNSQYKNDSFKIYEDENKNTKVEKVENKGIDINEINNLSCEDIKAKEDCLKLLGYDPFRNELEIDKPKLYNTLIDYLDESTLEDSFKIPTVIQIVKTFNQIDQIDFALSTYSSNPENIINHAKEINTLFNSKRSMLTSILGMAKDNGISVNHSNNKSKGAGTLSGILKKLGELDLDEAKVNLFDIETAEGMKQVANISNDSILEQLSMDENDYTEMLKEQNKLIDKLQSKLEKLEEENRLLKIKLKNGDQDAI